MEFIGRAPAAVPCPAGCRNDARRQLFDSYAEFTMRRGGIPVWDQTAYGLLGTHHDLQHLDAYTTRTTNLEMAQRILC